MEINMFMKIKKFVVIVLSFATSSVYAHITPEHVLGYSHESWDLWNVFGVLLSILILLFVISALSKKMNIE